MSVEKDFEHSHSFRHMLIQIVRWVTCDTKNCIAFYFHLLYNLLYVLVCHNAKSFRRVTTRVVPSFVNCDKQKQTLSKKVLQTTLSVVVKFCDDV
jgi:Na+/phosphate symporter